MVMILRQVMIWNRYVWSLIWCHNECECVSNHQPHECLLNSLFRRRSKKILKLHVTGLCEGNSPVTGEFPAQRASEAENVSIWWRHHGFNQSAATELLKKASGYRFELQRNTSTVYWCIASKLKAPRNFYWMSNMFLWMEIFLFFVCYHVVPKRHSQLDYQLNGL